MCRCLETPDYFPARFVHGKNRIRPEVRPWPTGCVPHRSRFSCSNIGNPFLLVHCPRSTPAYASASEASRSIKAKTPPVSTEHSIELIFGQPFQVDNASPVEDPSMSH